MTEMFVSDITDGIAGTGVKAAFLKCAIDAEGLTFGVERVLRAVARAHVATGAPVTVHTHPASRSGLVAIRVLREEGADLTRVVIGHSGDTGDLDYLAEVADAGCLLGMDRFGDLDPESSGQRIKTVAGMCERGYAGSMVIRPASSTGSRTTKRPPGTTPTSTTAYCPPSPGWASPPARSRACWSLTPAAISLPILDGNLATQREQRRALSKHAEGDADQ